MSDEASKDRATEYGHSVMPGATVGPFPECSEYARREAVVRAVEAVLTGAGGDYRTAVVLATYPCTVVGHGFHVTAGCLTLARNIDAEEMRFVADRLESLAAELREKR